MTINQLDKNLEYSLVLVKPDGVARRLSGEIIARLERKGYNLVSMKMVIASEEQLRAHYSEHAHKHFFGEMVEYMTEAPLVAMIFEGSRVIAGIRSVIGSTDPTEAAPGTIRGDFGCDSGSTRIENLVHASDSISSSRDEIKIWFPELKFINVD